MKTIRSHLHFIIIFPLVVIVMTWPALVYVFDSSTFWLPTERDDIYMLMWDAWYGGLILTDGADFFFTDLKFYPKGVSLAYHNFSLPHMFLLRGLSAIMPRSSAFNLTYLLLVLASASAAYIYLRYLLRDRWLSFFGAMVFGTSAFVLARPATPHISFIATVPLSLYLLHRGFVEGRGKLLVAAGGLIGFTAFIGLYTLVCLLISTALYIVCFARARWRQPGFWAKVVMVALVAGAIGAIRVAPMVADADGLSSALKKNIHLERGRDLLGYVVNYEHPVTGPVLKSLFSTDRIEGGWRQTVYLGYLPLLLVGVGLASAETRPRAWLWLALLLVFLLLRLGSTLSVNNVVYESIRLPKFYLAQIFPQIFQPFWTTDQFYAGAAFPFALLTCFGMKAVLRRLPRKRQTALILIAAGLIAFEYYQAPDPLVIPAEQLDFNSELRRQEDQDAINLIHLPMGGNISKLYDFYQSINGYPHVEGRPTRTPRGAFDYINGNLLLSAWAGSKAILCMPAQREDYLASLAQLEADGFTHIALHKRHGGHGKVAPSFTGIAPAYQDGYVSVYLVERLRASCENVSIPLPQPLAHLSEAAFSPALTVDKAAVVLSYHPAEPVDRASLYYLHPAFFNWQNFAHVYPREGEIQIQRLNLSHSDLKSFLRYDKLILLLYNPGQTGSDGLGELGLALAKDFQACPPVIDAANLVAVYYLRREFDCALLDSGARMQVEYENGARLENLIHGFDGEYLGIESWWTRLPDDAHGVSVQVFAGDGAKVAGGDFLIHHDSLARHRLDLSGLDPGDYELRLILYRAETGKSVPGIAVESQSPFQRELAIGAITID